MATGDPAGGGGTGRPERRIGPYRLFDVLGEGGMGTVYLAEQDEPVRRRVALKVIRRGMAERELLGRFERERQALAVMNHPHIARILDAGSDGDGSPYFAMELVQGEAITAYCDRHRLGLRERIGLFLQVCDGVQHAHHKGVIHRDLKPGNVLVELVDRTPRARIIDFGLARGSGGSSAAGAALTEYGRLLGTPDYMSPEQADATVDVDTRTDVWSLGVILFELATGALPFAVSGAAVNQLEMQRRLREVDPPLPSRRVAAMGEYAGEVARQRGTTASQLVRSLREDLDWIALKCLEKDRARRYQAPLELAADLERHLRGEPVAAKRPSVTYVFRKLVRRHRAAAGAVAAILATLVVALAWVTAARDEARSALASLRLQRAGERLTTLADSAAGLVPVSPVQLGAVDDLLREAASVVAPVDADGSSAPADAELQSRFASAHARAFVGDDAIVPRLQRQRDALVATLAAARQRDAEAWRAAQARVAADPRFAGDPPFELPVLEDLSPLGPDPASRLEEFAYLASGSVPARGADGVARVEDDSAIVLVLIPPGRPWLGAVSDDPWMQGVELPGALGPRLRPFLLAKHELTRSQWVRLHGGADPSRFRIGTQGPGAERITARSPVESVPFSLLYGVLRRFGLDLPSEAQWEHACRAGTDTIWWIGSEQDAAAVQAIVNVNDRTAGSLNLGVPGHQDWPELDDGLFFYVPAGSLRPNPWGLHELLGNVQEFCREVWVESHAGGFRDGDGLHLGAATDPMSRIVKGGGWSTSIRLARASARRSTHVAHAFDNLGCRVSRDL